MYLTNLGSSLFARFELFGTVTDIDDAVAKMQMAVDLTPDDHPDKSGRLTNLGNALNIRFGRLGNLADLTNAIIQQQRAVGLTPPNHPSQPRRLSNLASSLLSRFKQLGNVVDLDSAIIQYQAAVDLTPDNHPDKPSYLANLGSSLYERFDRSGNLIDLDGAITQERLAVNIMPEDHPNKPVHLNNLGISLQVRFTSTGNVSDIDDAITHQQRAVEKVTDGQARKPRYLHNLATSYLARFKRSHHQSDAESAVFHYSAAAMSSIGAPTFRFKSAGAWCEVASLIGHQSLLAAYECAIDLMPLVAWLGLPIADRHRHLVKIGGIARDAAAAAISLEECDKALEWLEQGRSIVWTQILQLRTPVDHLRDINPDLAERLLQISRRLDRGSQESVFLERELSSPEEEGRRYRGLVAEWESIIDQVRRIQGFESFLRPPSSSNLKKAAQNGPVVILNVAKERCDALALLPRFEEAIHIPLPNISSERVAQLQDELKDQLYSNGIRMRGERAAKRVSDEADNESCKQILAELWDNLVKPVMDSLAFSVRFNLCCVFKLLILNTFIA
jgi:tetratricopeptide (TPR) repeat protein